MVSKNNSFCCFVQVLCFLKNYFLNELLRNLKIMKILRAKRTPKTHASTEIRTQDLMLTKHALYQLSHGGRSEKERQAGPATPGSEGWFRSNDLRVMSPARSHCATSLRKDDLETFLTPAANPPFGISGRVDNQHGNNYRHLISGPTFQPKGLKLVLSGICSNNIVQCSNINFPANKFQQDSDNFFSENKTRFSSAWSPVPVFRVSNTVVSDRKTLKFVVRPCKDVDHTIYNSPLNANIKDPARRVKSMPRHPIERVSATECNMLIPRMDKTRCELLVSARGTLIRSPDGMRSEDMCHG